MGLPKLVLIWTIVASIICLWDAGFVLNRPRSLPGGDLHWMWKPYALYITIDHLYGDMKSGFVVAQSWLNLVELVISLAAVYVYYRPGATRREQKISLVVLLLANMATFWKTVIYFGQDIMSGWGYSGHNGWFNFLMLYCFPNGVWIVMPVVVMYILTMLIVEEESVKVQKAH